MLSLSCFDLEEAGYKFESSIGAGVFGQVCKAVDVSIAHTDDERPAIVAIKKIALLPHLRVHPAENLLKHVIREVRILRSVNASDHVIKILDAFIVRPPGGSSTASPAGPLHLLQGDLYLVMEFMEADLYQVLHGRHRQALTLEHVKYLTYQFLLGLDYLHSSKPAIVHRDLKPHNLLVNANCRLKIADFGLARVLTSSSSKKSGKTSNANYPSSPGLNTINNDGSTVPTNPMTVYVVARAYRAPELVFGLPSYSTAIDMWSVGCIVTEMITRQFLLPARNPIELVALMLSNFGPPPSSVIAQIPSEHVRSYVYRFQERLTGDARLHLRGLVHNHVVSMIGPVDQATFELETAGLVDFLVNLLLYDPDQRLSARSAQSHVFIKCDARPPMKPPKLTMDARFEDNISALSLDGMIACLQQEVDHFHHLREAAIKAAAKQRKKSKIASSTSALVPAGGLLSQSDASMMAIDGNQSSVECDFNEYASQSSLFSGGSNQVDGSKSLENDLAEIEQTL